MFRIVVPSYFEDVFALQFHYNLWHSQCNSEFWLSVPNNRTYHVFNTLIAANYQFHYIEGPFKSWWIQLITPSRYFVEVQWRSIFRSTFLGKRCISYNAPPTCRKRAACRPLIVSKFLTSKLPLHGSKSPEIGLYGGCSNGVTLIHFFQAEHRIQFRSRPMRSLGFSNHEKGAPMQEISKRSTVCSTFSRSGWGVLWSAALAKGGTSKKRPSPYLQLGVIIWVHKLFKRPSYIYNWIGSQDSSVL
jgi:hypothetical protein